MPRRPRPTRSPPVTSFTLVWIKMQIRKSVSLTEIVTSFTLVWIKMAISTSFRNGDFVTSFTLVWIKIEISLLFQNLLLSRASRSCGLKYRYFLAVGKLAHVTSFTLVWIKIMYLSISFFICFVTSFTLVWIKIGQYISCGSGGHCHELHARVD